MAINAHEAYRRSDTVSKLELGLELSDVPRVRNDAQDAVSRGDSVTGNEVEVEVDADVDVDVTDM